MCVHSQRWLGKGRAGAGRDAYLPGKQLLLALLVALPKPKAGHWGQLWRQDALEQIVHSPLDICNTTAVSKWVPGRSGVNA